MEQAKETKRKTKLFSVSFRDEDLDKLEQYLKDVKRQTGFELSRNELIRRAVLAHVGFKRKGSSPEYDDVFKAIN